MFHNFCGLQFTIKQSIYLICGYKAFDNAIISLSIVLHTIINIINSEYLLHVYKS